MNITSTVGRAPVTITITVTDAYEQWALLRACGRATKNSVHNMLSAGDEGCPSAAAEILYNLIGEIHRSFVAAQVTSP